MPSSRSLRFAVGTSLVSALALTSGCNKTKTSNVAPHEEPPHTNVAHQEEPQPEAETDAETPEPDPNETVNVAPHAEPEAP
jgi:hypothetical protein